MRRDPGDLRRALVQVATAQSGYFTAAQAVDVGYSYPAQHYHTERGDWNRVDRGLYQLQGWPVDPHADLVRWALWSRGQGIVSHDSALSVYEIGDVMPVRTHLTVPSTFRSRSTAVLLHRGTLAEGDVEDHGSFRVTSVHRSLLDAAAAHMEVDRLAHAVGDALDRGLTTPSRLLEDAPRIAGSSGPITLALRQLTS